MILVLILLYNISTVSATESTTKDRKLIPTDISMYAMEEDVSDGIIEAGENIENHIDEVWIITAHLLSRNLIQESAEFIKENFINNARVELLNDEELLSELQNIYNDFSRDYRENYNLYDHSFSDEDFIYHFYLGFFYEQYFFTFFKSYGF